jgi:hypothetical protein
MRNNNVSMLLGNDVVKITPRNGKLRFENSQLIDQGLKSIITESPSIVEEFSPEFCNTTNSPIREVVQSEGLFNE